MTYRIIIRVESEQTSRGDDRIVADGLTEAQARFVASALPDHVEDELKYIEEQDLEDDERLRDGNEEHE